MVGKGEIRGMLLAVAGLVALLLLVASTTPGLPGELLLQSLRVHLLAAGAVVLVGLLVVGIRWRAALFGLLLLAAAGHLVLLLAELGGRRSTSVPPDAREVEVLSYNVLTGNDRAEDALEHIIELAPDIAVILETPGIEPYIDRLAAVFPYHLGCENTESCDLSIWSQHPITAARMLRPPPFGFERLGVAEVDLEGKRLTVVAAHFSKPYFDEASWVEAGYLGDVLQAISGPVVLAGDFNAAPWSDPLIRLARRAGLAPASSFPATWPVRLGPLGVPIDNMFTRGAVRIEAIAAGPDSFGSNHRYLLARVSL